MGDVAAAAAAALVVWGLLAGARRAKGRNQSRRALARLTLSEPRPGPAGSDGRPALLAGVAAWLETTPAGARLARYAQRTHPSLPYSDVVALILCGAVGGGLAGWILFGAAPMVALSAVAGPLILDRALVKLSGRRIARFEQQLPEALALQTAALRAGHSTERSLRNCASRIPAPLGEALDRAVREIDLGASLEASLSRMSGRIASRDVDLWVTAMIVQRRTGGNLSAVLESLSNRIVDRMHMRGEIRALTAQARFSGLVVALAPAGFFLLLSATARDQMQILFSTPLGIAVLVAGMALEIAGLLWIRWITRMRM